MVPLSQPSLLDKSYVSDQATYPTLFYKALCTHKGGTIVPYLRPVSSHRASARCFRSLPHAVKPQHTVEDLYVIQPLHAVGLQP